MFLGVNPLLCSARVRENLLLLVLKQLAHVATNDNLKNVILLAFEEHGFISIKDWEEG